MRGRDAEDRALAHLVALGHTPLARNFRVPGGELDLVTGEPTPGGRVVVFTEVRQRRSAAFGGALESVTPRKAALLRRAARHYLLRAFGTDEVACRFDLVAIDGTAAGGRLTHLRNVLD